MMNSRQIARLVEQLSEEAASVQDVPPARRRQSNPEV
jgi:hypothetical protein